MTPGNMAEEQYRLQRLIWELNYIRILDLYIMVTSCNINFNGYRYAFIENVVTHSEYRGHGYATKCLEYAKYIAEQNNCYKMMLLTGSKKESTLRFYENAGYNSSDKTAFIQWLE